MAQNNQDQKQASKGYTSAFTNDARKLRNINVALFIFDCVLLIGAFVLALLVILSYYKNLNENPTEWEEHIGAAIDKWTAANYLTSYTWWIANNVNVQWMSRVSIIAAGIGAILTLGMGIANVTYTNWIMEDLEEKRESNVRPLYKTIMGSSITQIILAICLIAAFLTFEFLVDVCNKVESLNIYVQYILVSVTTVGILIVLLEPAQFACGINQYIRIQNGAK